MLPTIVSFGVALSGTLGPKKNGHLLTLGA